MTHVLIIDSNNAAVSELTGMLASFGIESHVAGDGNQGIVMARALAPDAIVLSVELRQGSGYTVCNRLKKDPHLLDIPLILVSQQGSEAVFEEHRQLRTHADAYLLRPFSEDAFLTTLRQFISFSYMPKDTTLQVETTLGSRLIEQPTLPARETVEFGAARPPSRRVERLVADSNSEPLPAALSESRLLSPDSFQPQFQPGSQLSTPPSPQPSAPPDTQLRHSLIQFGQALAQYKEEGQAVESKQRELEQSVASWRARCMQIEHTVESLQGRVASLEQQLTAWQQELALERRQKQKARASVDVALSILSDEADDNSLGLVSKP